MTFVTWLAWVTCAFSVLWVFGIGVYMAARRSTPSALPSVAATRVAVATVVLIVAGSLLSLASALA